MDDRMDDRMDDGTKLHFIPTSAATVRPASREASFVRLQGKLHLSGFRGSFIRTASGDASFGRLQASRTDGQIQGKLHLVGLTLPFIYVIFLERIIARLWHNSRPLKDSTLIWQTFNQGFLVELWLACMGFPSNNEVC
jgi:hypothetical protein